MNYLIVELFYFLFLADVGAFEVNGYEGHYRKAVSSVAG